VKEKKRRASGGAAGLDPESRRRDGVEEMARPSFFLAVGERNTGGVYDQSDIATNRDEIGSQHWDISYKRDHHKSQRSGAIREIPLRPEEVKLKEMAGKDSEVKGEHAQSGCGR